MRYEARALTLCEDMPGAKLLPVYRPELSRYRGGRYCMGAPRLYRA